EAWFPRQVHVYRHSSGRHPGRCPLVLLAVYLHPSLRWHRAALYDRVCTKAFWFIIFCILFLVLLPVVYEEIFLLSATGDVVVPGISRCLRAEWPLGRKRIRRAANFPDCAI